MPPIADFVEDPDEFLKDNILQSLWSGNPLRGPVRRFSFELAPFQGRKLIDGNLIPVYRLIPLEHLVHGTRRNRDYLKAYFCPFGVNETHAIMVAGEADFMFTTNMDGCTFGVGSEAPGGARRVSHCNIVGVGERNGHIQKRILTRDGLTDHMVDPRQYPSLADPGAGGSRHHCWYPHTAQADGGSSTSSGAPLANLNDPTLLTVKRRLVRGGGQWVTISALFGWLNSRSISPALMRVRS